MELLLITIFVVFAYMGLLWFTCINPPIRSNIAWFLSSSLAIFLSLGGLMLVNMFWVLFVAFLVLLIATYIGGNEKFGHCKPMKNGVFGGFWLLVPLYVFLSTNT